MTGQEPSPHSRYRHVYAIVRYDGDIGPPAERVTVTKIMEKEAEAQDEVNRLNTLNAPKGSVYFYQLTRMTTG